MRHFRSLGKVLLSVVLTSTAAPRLAYSQSSVGSTITFESLKAKQAPQPATPRPTVVKKTDTIRVERLRIDTVRVERLRIDTVRIERLRVDTVRVPIAVAPSVTAALSVTPTPSATAAPPNSASTIAANPYVAPTFAGLLQMWAVAGDAGYRNTYRVRRAELKTVVDLGDHAKGTVMLDLAKALALTTSGSTAAVSQSSRVLQDAFISTPVSRMQVDVGQMKLPLGKEGMASSAALETVERALMFSDRARGGSFGDVRDLGAQVRGVFATSEFQAGLFNGSGEGQNDVDKNVGKSFVARAAVRPLALVNLQLGVSGATAGRASADKATRDRVGGEIEYCNGRLMLRSEVMHGQDGAITRLGYYALGTLAVRPTVKIVARYDAWDPDTHKETTPADVTEHDYLLGGTWLPPQTRLKLQLAAVRRTYADRITPAVTQALLNVQASW